jgi:hypothetical protein
MSTGNVRNKLFESQRRRKLSVTTAETKPGLISKPGGFKNDPPDPANPNEVRERALRKLRP